MHCGLVFLSLELAPINHKFEQHDFREIEFSVKYIWSGALDGGPGSSALIFDVILLIDFLLPIYFY